MHTHLPKKARKSAMLMTLALRKRFTSSLTFCTVSSFTSALTVNFLMACRDEAQVMALPSSATAAWLKASFKPTASQEMMILHNDRSFSASVPTVAISRHRRMR